MRRFSKTRKSPGYSLIEVLLVIGLVSLCLLLGMQGSPSRSKQATSGTASEELAQALRWARELAISREMPTAVVFKTQQGNNPVVSQFDIVGGEAHPQLIRRYDMAQDYPGLAIFLGQFQGATPDPVSSTFTSAHTLVSRWQPAETKESYIAFAPTGEVQVQGATLYEGGYRFLLTQGCQYGSAGRDQNSNPLFRVETAVTPSTVTVSPLGEVSVSSGIPFSHTVALTQQPMSIARVSEQAQEPQAAQSPKLTRVDYTPDPSLYQLPAEVDQLVAKDGLLSARVEASAPQAAFLTLQVSQPSGQLGSASPAEPERMQWDAQKGCWVGWIHWKPPADAADHSKFTIALEVRDDHGQSAAHPAKLGLLSLEVRAQKRKLVYSAVSKVDLGWTSNLSGSLSSLGSGSPNSVVSTERLAIFSAEADSTAVRQLTFPKEGEQHLLPDWSPDGRKLLYLAKDKAGSFSLWTVGSDGMGAQRLMDDVEYGSCGWSLDGSHIGFQRKNSLGEVGLWVADADGTGHERCITPAGDGWTYGEKPTGLTSQEIPKLQWSDPAYGPVTILTTRYRAVNPVRPAIGANALCPTQLSMLSDWDRWWPSKSSRTQTRSWNWILATQPPQSSALPATGQHCTQRRTGVAYTRVYRDGHAKICKAPAVFSGSHPPEELATAMFGTSETVSFWDSHLAPSTPGIQVPGQILQQGNQPGSGTRRAHQTGGIYGSSQVLSLLVLTAKRFSTTVTLMRRR
jgi:type II secretory pathway pseudopilin PulG